MLNRCALRVAAAMLLTLLRHFMTFSSAVHLVRQVLVRYSRDDVDTLPTSWVDVDDIYARAHLTLERRSTVYIVR